MTKYNIKDVMKMTIGEILKKKKKEIDIILNIFTYHTYSKSMFRFINM